MRLINLPCDGSKSQRWLYYLENGGKKGKLRNVEADRCVDAGDTVSPVLYPCYPAGSNPKQMFEMLENGQIKVPHSWGDNGRLRYPAKCLDSNPSKPVHL